MKARNLASHIALVHPGKKKLTGRQIKIEESATVADTGKHSLASKAGGWFLGQLGGVCPRVC